MASPGGCANSVGMRLVEARVRPVAPIVFGKVSVTHGDRNKNLRDAFQISFFRVRLCESRPVNERAEAAVCKHGGGRAIGGHTLTNRHSFIAHSFIAGVRSADNLHARASLGRALCCSIKGEVHQGGGSSRGREIKENAMILAKTRRLLAGVAAAAVILALGFV